MTDPRFERNFDLTPRPPRPRHSAGAWLAAIVFAAAMWLLLGVCVWLVTR